jgi:hypothetical protein
MGQCKYVKIVEWLRDQCYVGSCPGLLLGGCHGITRTVFPSYVKLSRKRLIYF